MNLNLSLGVANLEQTQWFYHECLTLPLRRLVTGGGNSQALLLELSHICLTFQLLKDLEARHPALLQNLTRSFLGLGLQLEFDCPDLERIALNFKHHGWPVAYELEDRQHKRQEIWVQDPDGYLLILNREASQA